MKDKTSAALQDTRTWKNRFQAVSVESDGRGNVTCFALTNDGRLYMMMGHPSQAKGDAAKTWIRVSDAPDEGEVDA